jgi:hypothetical protein
MRRAYLDLRVTLGEWRERHPLDADLPPSYFRKGRRVRGCPRFCVHCRRLRSLPTRQQLRADLSMREWQAEAFPTPWGIT